MLHQPHFAKHCRLILYSHCQGPLLEVPLSTSKEAVVRVLRTLMPVALQRPQAIFVVVLRRVVNWLQARVERPDVRQQGGAQRYEGVWAGSQARSTPSLPTPSESMCGPSRGRPAFSE